MTHDAAGKIPEIVLTGGPGGGKSTSLAVLSQKLSDWGFRPLVIPEVATLLVLNAVRDIGDLAVHDVPRFIEVQRTMLRMQGQLRAEYARLGSCFAEQRPVILCDRAEMDAMAYIGEEAFMTLIAEEGLDLAAVRDSYEAVIHLVTAAEGAEEHYTQANNQARRESAAEARDADARTLAAWTGHPHLRVIGNDVNDFEEKVANASKALARALGIPVPIEIERKFLVTREPDLHHPALAAAVVVDIEQAYLEGDDERTVRIRRRSQGGSAIHYLTVKTQMGSGLTRGETERIISADEYQAYLGQLAPGTKIVRKRRHCLVYRNQYLELDQFISPKPMWMLEVELTEEGDLVHLPPFLNGLIEVSEDVRYSNAHMAGLFS